jgi:2-polyprenyl-3-methyl-5-hydroxy-6-metoxy-1,4-benzoquinol methylase
MTAMKHPAWRFHEFRQIGRDYTSSEEVRVYDETHAQFRDIVAESNQALDRLNLSRGMVLLDIGCGTGTFAIEAARRGLNVHATDVSKTMLTYAKKKAGATAITFHHSGAGKTRSNSLKGMRTSRVAWAERGPAIVIAGWFGFDYALSCDR